MIPYFIVLFISILIAITIDKLKSIKILSNFFIGLNAILLILFAGLRNSSVGTDTSGYIRSFLGNEPVFSRIMDGMSSFEIGYQFLELLAAQFSNNYYALLITIAAFITYFQFKGIYKLSIIPSISIFILISFGFYTFAFNGARQGIALAIFIYAIQFIVNKNFIKYAITIGVGFLFHKTIIILLPFYFLFRLKFSFKLFSIIVLTTLFIIVFFDRILNIGLFISNKYSVYTEMKASGGQLLTLAYLTFGVFFILIKPFLIKTCYKKYDIYLNMYLIGPIIFIIVQFTGAYIEITRLAIYFLSAAIFIWPIIFKNIKNDVKPFVFLFFSFSNLLFFFVFISKIGNLTPYIFNNQLFNNF